MPKEVSQMMMQCSLEAGALFGVPRAEMLRCLTHPGRLDCRWSWFDWDEYCKVLRLIFGQVGTGPELVTAGQRYLNERYRTRSAHLYAQYTTWERALWVAKTLMARRMMKGYRIDYTDQGNDRFEVTMTIPEHLQGFPDFFYFLTGVWTGSSPQAKLQHTLHSLQVTPHHAVADITFDQRSLHSRVAFNPLYSRLKSIWELRRCRGESRKVANLLAQETENLDKAFDAVSNAVLLIRENRICMANRNARALLASEAALADKLMRDLGSSPNALPGGIWTTAGKSFRVRQVTLSRHGRQDRLISLEDQSGLQNLEEKIAEVAGGIRFEAERRLNQTLGAALDELTELLARARGEETSPEVRSLLQNLEALAGHCRRQGLALVEGDPPRFHSDAELIRAVDDLAQEFSSVFGFHVHRQGDVLPPLADASARGLLFLMIQEALRNAWRHSGSEEARVSFTATAVSVTDGGRGFPETIAPTAGLGVCSLRERAELLGFRAMMLRGQQTGWRFESNPQGEHAA